MKFFLDTADINQIVEFKDYNFIDGVTTNPSLILKSGRDFKEVIEEISAIINGDISAEVTGDTATEMIEQGEKLASIASNIVVKVPLTKEGLKACYALAKKSVAVNVTLCFSPAQAILAARSGAKYISPFVGRLDDVGHDGMQLIEEITYIYERYSIIDTKVLVASIRSVKHIVDAAKMGADVVTVPPKVLWQMFQHPLTDKGLEVFEKDWQETGQKI